MYEKFFELAEVPFKILPDARFLWYSEQHKEAKEKIDFHVQQKDGPVYLSADVGLGKTTIAQRIKDELKANKTKKVVYVFAPHLRSQNQFMRFIAGTEGFDIKTARSFQETLTSFEKYLLEQFEKGVTQVLLIDEAQNLPYDALKTIHHLFNFSTPNQFLIQIALFGQPELQKRIQSFPSLASRMYPAKLRPFARKETEDMMQFRWTVAGGHTLPFDTDALDEVHRLSRGVPRNICKLANEALLHTMVARSKTVTQDFVSSAAKDAFEEA